MPFISLPIAVTALSLVWMGFFMMGSAPLLVLKHDTPMDARVVRAFFNVNYIVVMVIAPVAALGYAWAGRSAFALGAACLACFAFTLRRWVIIPRMDALRGTMHADDAAAISRFRRLHIVGMLLNVAQIGLVVWALTRLRL